MSTMSPTGKKYLTCAETAKLLRAALKAEFPAVKFGVRSKTYSGGASIDVSWTDGPITADVKPVCDRYEGATFDGMIDLKEYKDTLVTTADGAELVSMGADFIFENRGLSPEFEAELLAEIQAFAAGVEGCPAVDVGDWKTSLPISTWKDSDNGYRTELSIDRHGFGNSAGTLVHQLGYGRSR